METKLLIALFQHVTKPTQVLRASRLEKLVSRAGASYLFEVKRAYNVEPSLGPASNSEGIFQARAFFSLL